MKKFKIFSIILLLTSFSFHIFSEGFNHPGMLHTNEDFIRIKAQLAAGEPSVTAGYNILISNEWAQSTVGTYPADIIKRGITGDENYINAARGAHAAYLNALRWKITGNTAHAERAVYILNSWAAVTTAIGGNTNLSLASGLYGYEFANAAELMRDYSGWKKADFAKFQDWMQFIWYPYVYDFLIRRHGTWEQGTPGHYWSNWGLCNALALISIGVLCDDEFMYNQGVAFYKYDKIGTFRDDSTLANVDNWGLTEFIGNLVPVLHKDSRSVTGYFGQMQESGRDQGHATMALGLAVDICEIAWNQGDDLYGYMDNRLLSGIEYLAAYNSGIDSLAWTDYWYHDVRTSYANSWKQLGPNAGSRGQFRPYWDRILGHYEGRKGLMLNYAHKMANIVVADGGATGGTSGGYDHLGFTTLTCSRPLLSADKAPLTLTPSITYNGKNYKQGEVSNIPAGTTIQLTPALPADETDTGNWQWSTGHNTRELTLSADTSSIYRVQYTNSKGVISTQMFSIAVLGDCRPDRYSYTVNTTDGVFSDTVLVVDQNSKVLINLSASSWRSTWLWNTKETISSKEIKIGTRDSVFSVTGTNLGGAKKTINFTIKVKPIGPAYQTGTGPLIYSEKVLVVAGQTAILKPTLKTGMEGGSWRWSDGSSEQNLTLTNIQSEKEITVTYTYGGSDYTIKYNLVLVPKENSYAYWSMDEGSGAIVHDVWAGNDASLNTSVWNQTGVKGKSLKLDGGANSYVSLPNDFLANVSDFTVSVWVKPLTLDNWARVWDFGSSTSYNMFLTSKASDGFVRFAIKAGGSEQQITTSRSLSIGKWSHIVVTKSGNTGRLYINGTQAGLNSVMTLNPSILGFTTKNYVGKSQWADPMLNGSVDELQIYKTSFTQAEVLELRQNAEPFEANFSVDSGTVVTGNRIAVVEGQNIRLSAQLKPGMELLSGLDTIHWKWDNGDTLQNLTIKNIVQNQTVSLKYFFAGKAYTILYDIILKPEKAAIAYWKMDDTQGNIMKDSWSINDGDIRSSVWTDFGKYDGGLTLDGSATSFVKLPDNLTAGLKDFTISLWVNPSELSNWARIFDFGINQSYYMFLTSKAGDGYLRYAIKAGGTEQSVTTSTVLGLNIWTNIAITRSGNLVRVYVNGKLAGSNASITISPANLGITTNNLIGKSQFADPMLKAILDEFRIYSRAFNIDEITAMYNNTELKTVTQNELSVYPNPFSNQLNIQLKNESSLKKIEILSIDGQLVGQFKIEPSLGLSQELELSYLPNGIYLVVASTESSRFIRKVIKQD